LWAVALLAAATAALLAGPGRTTAPARLAGGRPDSAAADRRAHPASAGMRRGGRDRLVGWRGAGGVAGVVLAVGAADVARRRRRLRLAAACRASVPVACRSIAADLAAGVAPAASLAAASASAPAPLAGALAGAAAAEPLGVDPATVLAARPPPGCERLVLVAACWTVCTATGGGLAGALSRLADGLSDEHEAAATVAAELVGPRMSALVMAVLPVVGIALGTALGARPLHFLTTTVAGLVCLTGGCALDAVGLLWVSRIARAAVR
jgi:tight adherence protein B